MRFYDVDSGSIMVDEQDIYGLTRHSLRSAYTMVLQDTWLFHGSIRDNIAYARPDATTEQIEAAARAAMIHSFITKLPGGYDTLIGDDGVSISKGKRQLLTIARAMLSDARMLIWMKPHQRGPRPAHPGGHAPFDGPPHHVRDCPPPVHHSERGHHPGGAGREHRGTGEA